MARSPSTNMNFWARAPLNLVADRVKNSVPPLLRTLRFCVGDRRQNYMTMALTTLVGVGAGDHLCPALRTVAGADFVQGGGWCM